MKETKIVLTGGHAGSTALAVIKELEKRDIWSSLKLYWFGNKYALENDASLTSEFKILPPEGVTFVDIDSGRLQTKFTKSTIPAAFKLLTSAFKTFEYLYRVKPDLVFSFGGSTSFWTVVFSKIFFGKKILLHEQTAAAGRASQIEGYFADKIFISRKTSEKYFEKQKLLLTGNPINPYITNATPYISKSGLPILLVSGGSRGSRILNDVFFKIVKNLNKHFEIIHQVGESNLNYYRRKALKLKLKNYRVLGFVNPEKWARYIIGASIFVSRAGANTVTDVLFAKVPTIFVPLLIAFRDEQRLNAQYAESLGIASILTQNSLTPELLEEKILKLETNSKHQKGIVFENPDTQAAKRIVDEIIHEIKK